MMERSSQILLPFGSIEDEERTVHLDGSGYTKIDVPGLAEIFESGLPEMELENGNRFKFCTLPGIVLLKLLAWEHRPEGRTKDIIDISEILDHFLSINDEEIWEHHSDLFVDPGAELLKLGQEFWGARCKELLSKMNLCFRELKNFLKKI